MDITKIDEARKLFTQLEDTERMHEFAIKEFSELAKKSFHFQYIKYPEFAKALALTIHTHFVALKDEIKAEIEKL